MRLERWKLVRGQVEVSTHYWVNLNSLTSIFCDSSCRELVFGHISLS